jgi:hypothetical protein
VSSTEPLAALARIRRRHPAADEMARCDFCAVPIGPEGGWDHVHLVDLESHSLRCACRPCGLLFDHRGAGGGHVRRVPDRWLAVPGFSPDRPEWDATGIPVGVVFVFVSSETGQPVAFYPGPAGATESLLPLGPWDRLVAAHPELAGMEDDVEAALVFAGDEPGRSECFVVPVDACYELTGLLRRTWRGFDGGSEARRALAEFKDRVRTRAGRHAVVGG